MHIPSQRKQQSGNAVVATLIVVAGFVGTMALVMNSWSPILEEQLAIDTEQARIELTEFNEVLTNVIQLESTAGPALDKLKAVCHNIPEREHYYATRVGASLRAGFTQAQEQCASLESLTQHGMLTATTLSSLTARKSDEKATADLNNAVIQTSFKK